MKKILFIALAVILALSVGLIGCGGGGGGGTVTLKVATYFGPTTGQCVMLDAFCNDLQVQSGGCITTLKYWGGSLASGPGLYNGAVGGTIDIVFTMMGYNSGVYSPVEELFSMPLGIPSAWCGSKLVQDLFTTYNFSCFNTTHPLFFSVSAPLVIYSRMPLTNLTDISGRLIRVPAPNNCIMSGLGATPNNMGMPLVWDALYKNNLDGVMIGCDGFSSWNLHQVTNYTTFHYAAGGDVFLCTMSNACWNSLSPALQAAVTTVANTYAGKVCDMWLTENKNSLQIGLAAGNQFICVNGTERDAWKTAVDGCYGNKTAELIAKGFTNETIQGWINYTQTQLGYWIGVQNTTPGKTFHFCYP